jgi:hypothetical protein
VIKYVRLNCVNKFLSVPIKLPESEATHCHSDSCTFSLISRYNSYFCSSVKGHEFKTCEKTWTANCVKFDVILVYCYQKSQYPIHSQENLLSNQSRPIGCSTTYLYQFQYIFSQMFRNYQIGHEDSKETFCVNV